MIRRVILLCTAVAVCAIAQLARAQETLHMVGHAHIDEAYRWRWSETLKTVIPFTFRGVLDLMDKEPQLTFVQSQMVIYDATRHEYPDLFERMKARIREGRWEVVGGQWTEPLTMSAAGEATVREFLIGKQYAREVLGADVKVGWTPDAWDGQISTLPQILKGCGIDYYVVSRGRIRHKPAYRWESPDGSRVIVYTVPFAYNYAIATPAEVEPAFTEWKKDMGGLQDIMQMYGRGDHGGGPRDTDLEAFHRFTATPGAPAIVFDSAKGYLDKFIAPLATKLPVVSGNMRAMGPDTATPGDAAPVSYATPFSVRGRYRENLNALLIAEKFNSIGTFHQRKPFYSRIDFNDAWKALLETEDHNMLTANSRVYEDIDRKFEFVASEAKKLLRQGLEYIGTRVDTTGPGIPLLVYNPSSWKRSGAVEAHLHVVQPAGLHPQFSIRDAAGHAVAWQLLHANASGKDLDLLVDVADLPATGYRLLRAFPGGVSPPARLLATPSSLENEHIRLRINGAGAVTSLYDKEGARETLSSPANVLELMNENPLLSDSYVLQTRFASTARLTLTGAPVVRENGPVRAIVRSTYRSEDSEFALDTVLYAHSRRVEFILDADWHDRNKTLQVRFPVALSTAHATFERPYGFEELPANGARQPLQQWFDLSNSTRGVSLLSAGIAEGYADAGSLRVTLLRGARDMNARMDEGHHVLRYAIYPHAGSWNDSGTVRQAEEFNSPLAALQEPHHPGEFTGWGTVENGKLPRELSFLSTSPENVIATAVKISQAPWEKDTLIVRVFETAGRGGEAQISLGMNVSSAEEVNLIEEPAGKMLVVEKNKVRLTIGPRQIKTLRLSVSALGGKEAEFENK